MISKSFEVILSLMKNELKRGEKIGTLQVLRQYSVLLTMRKLMLKAFGIQEDIFEAELKPVETFLLEHHIDLKLTQNGISQFYSKVTEEENKVELWGKITSDFQKKGEISLDVILENILPANEMIIEAISEGSDISRLISYSLKIEKVTKEPAADALNENVKEEKSEVSSKSKEPKAENKKKRVQSTKSDKKSFIKLSSDYKKLRTALLSVVKGQNDPVFEFIQGCFHADLMDSSLVSGRNLPKATFLFVGPPGVGKTLLATTAADVLGYKTKTFNMSEYTTQEDISKLIGYDRNYKAAKSGSLTSFVEECNIKNTPSILVFDEIEKACLPVINLFLQILDLGTIRDQFEERDVSFKNTYIIFTSNAGKQIYENNYGNISGTPKSVIMSALETEKSPLTGRPFFPQAICSRVASGNVIMFNHISPRTMTDIANDVFDKVKKTFTETYRCKIEMDEKLSRLFLFRYGASLDARIASRRSESFITDELYEVSRQLESHPDLFDQVNKIRFELDLSDPDISAEIQNLFVSEKNERFEVIILCNEKDREKFMGLPDTYSVSFVTTLEELKTAVDEDLSIVIIDPLFGLSENSKRGVSLDDYDTVGVKAFFEMMENPAVPVYILESEKSLAESDRNTFYQSGASGMFSLVDRKENILSDIISVSEDIFMEKKWTSFSRRGYVLDYNTAQKKEGKTLIIQFHELKKKQAIDASSSSAFISDEERPTVKFSDVIGAENAKEELQYFIQYLSNPKTFIRNGGKPAKGILLYGPPGTGKTLLARAMAGESNVAFLQTSASAFLSKYVGESEQNVRTLFERAKKYAPAIIFIDEIDAIGKRRTGDDHSDSVLNALLTEMDGFTVDPKRPVFVLAATNFDADENSKSMRVLDEALVRRFDNKILVDLPNIEEREKYIRLTLEKKGFVEVSDSVIHNISLRTPGYSLAILERIVDLAFRNAVKRNEKPGESDLTDALSEYTSGEKREHSKEYMESVAIHESGHAYISCIFGEKPAYMTIESRGDYGGYMQRETDELRGSYTKDEFINLIRISLAGRAAEEVFFGKEKANNTGASSDLLHASNYALHMLTTYGMMEGQLLSLPLETVMHSNFASDYMTRANSLLLEEMEETIRLVKEGKDKVKALADKVLEYNHLTGDQIAEVLEN